MLVAPLVGLAIAYLVPRRLYDAAVTIDRTQGLKDGTATAMHFMKGEKTPLRELQIEDTGRRVSGVNPAEVAPFVTPQSWLPGLTLTCVAAVIAFLAARPTDVVANVVPNEVVSSQAMRIDQSLEELEEFNTEELDPEVEELLKDLAKNIEELKRPEMDPKEALGKVV